MDKLSQFWNRVQCSLFPHLEKCLPVLTQKHKDLAIILELVRIEEHFRSSWTRKRGRRPYGRQVIARAFLAKMLYNIATTKELIERLHTDESFRQICGWHMGCRIPSESTFSRAFAEFSDAGLGDIVHQAIVINNLADEPVWHISRDSTAIPARERAAPKPEKLAKKRGRPRNDATPPPPKRIMKQFIQTPEEAIAELPKLCDLGVKRDSGNRKGAWIGYKLHVDIADGGIPISAITTSASLHDSQAAIPLAKMSAMRVRSFYDLMDSAYDAGMIHEASELLGHVAIIDPAPLPGGRGKKPPLEPDRALRYKIRTTVERFNAHFKDNRGGRNIRVRGHSKVHMHMMLGVIVIFAETFLGLLP